MNILHIGDIHLGCYLDNNSRNEEIKNVFEFIRKTVVERKVSAALIAGDVFDNGRPAAESQDIYYNFLLDLQKAGCQQIIVIAGNHDNPDFLDAPKWLLNRLDIHVVGNVNTNDLAKEVFALGDKEVPAAFVCAVPNLEHRDVCGQVPADNMARDRSKELAYGVAEHYRNVWRIADGLRQGRNIPIIGMGHLYATGSSFGTAKNETVVGKLEGVDLNDFAGNFDYMALGHIHKPQIVEGHDNWRYAGSILPMKIQEHNYVPEIVLLDTNDMSHPISVKIPTDCLHNMAYIAGDMKELRSKLTALRGTDTWVKIVYTGETNIPNWAIDLRLEYRESGVQIVDTEVKRPSGSSSPDGISADKQENSELLSKLTPERVFLKYMEKHKDDFRDEQQREALLNLYRTSQNKVCSPEQQTEATAVPIVGVMKFKRLFIKNVNSLYGEHTIDFEDEAFKTGIFLIDGPTGAGKTSILDSICLALYAQTPRSEKITQTNNPAMSEGTNDIQAELTFSLGGDEYRASFSQKRTKEAQKPFGIVQHHLYKNGEETKSANKTDVKDEIINLVGMTLAQFTQCVLLAQGSFDAFLKAKSNDRAPLLTKITGTEIYNTIGMQIFKDFEEIKNQKKHLEEKLKGFTLLWDSDVKNLEAQLQQKKAERDAVDDKLRKCEVNEQIFKAIEVQKIAVMNGEKDLDAAKKAQTEAVPKQDTLKNAQRAQRCQAKYDEFTQQSARLKDKQDELTKLQNRHTELEQAVSQAEKAKQAAGDVLTSLMEVQKEKQLVFQKVRTLDTKITDKKKDAVAAATECNNASAQKEEADKAFGKATKAWETKQKAAQTSTDYLTAHEADRDLVHKKEGWELRCTALITQEASNSHEAKEITDALTALEASRQNLTETEQQKEKVFKTLDDLKATIADNEKKREEALGGMDKSELTSLWAAAGKLQDFFKGNNSRQVFLTANQPCPLCGSTSHPYCDGTAVPEAHDYSKDVAELKARLKTVEACEKALDNDRPKQAELATVLENLKRECKEKAEEIQNTEQTLKKRQQDLAEKQNHINDDARVLADEFKAALQVEWQDHAALPAELQTRIDAFAHAQTVVNALEAEKQAFDKAKAAYDAVAQKNADGLKAKEQILNDLQNELDTLQKDRMTLFGNGNVDSEETKLSQRVENARTAADKCSQNKVIAETDLKNNNLAIEQNNREQNDLMPQVQTAKAVLESKLQECGFKDLGDFVSKRMEMEMIQKLQDELTTLATAVVTAEATLTQRREVLADEQKKVPEGIDRQKNLDDQKELDTQKAEIQKQYDEINSKLVIDEHNRQQSQEVRKKCEELDKVFNNWNELNSIFGGQQGDNFARIAQGYTFRGLLFCANKNRLTSLRNHFTLVGDDKDPLELNVIDHYRGDQVRTAKNLSGGESFEVSLALALGLADMSSISQKASLGNVLLDEGFGTLDDNALDSALDLLAQLNNKDNKLVGIISHVAKLGDRIATQIHVSTSGGMGRLEGAGVKSLADTRILWDAEHPQEAEKRKKDEDRKLKEAAKAERKAARLAKKAAEDKEG